MSRRCLMGIVALGFVMATAGLVYADHWHKIAALTAGGDAKEVTVDKTISKCIIKCTSGSVIINTLVVREGAKKTPIKVVTTFTEGQDKLIEIGERRMVTGFRISDQGSGTYSITVNE